MAEDKEYEPLMEGDEPKPKKRKKREPKTAMIQRILEDPATLIGTLVSRTESIMSPRAQAWRRYRAKYRLGLQYMSGDTGKVPDIFTVNYLFSNIEAVKSNVGKSMPKITVSAFELSDQMAADLVSKLLEVSLKKGGLPRAQRKVVHNAAITGVAWFKHWYNPDGNGGDGGNVTDCIPPEDVLVDPLAVPFLTQDGRTTARYLIHRRRDVSWDEIEATYDVNPEKIFGDDQDTIDASFSLGTTNDYVNDVRQKPFGNLQQNPYGKVLDVYECWLQTFEPFEADEQTGEVISSPWYIITVAGDRVLKKAYSPYQHGKLPFVPWFDGEDDGAADFYHIGIGEVEEVEMLQDKAALLDLQIYRNIKMTVNRQRIVNRLMGVSKDTVDNQAGRVYEVAGDPRLAMVWDTPPQLGNDVYTYRQGAEKSIQDVSGVTDVMAGRKPTGIAAAKAIGALQNASLARIADKQATLIESLKAVAEMDLANIFQFYTTERVIRLLDGNEVRVIGEYPPELQPGYQPVQEAGVDPMTGAPVPAMDLPPLGEGPELDALRDQWKAMNGIDLVLSEVDRRYDLIVGQGSPLPEDKGELGQLALDMFRIGLIDRKAALDILEWPDRAEIIGRMGAQQTGPGAAAQPDQQMQMVQQLMQAMSGGMPPGGGMPVG